MNIEVKAPAKARVHERCRRITLQADTEEDEKNLAVLAGLLLKGRTSRSRFWAVLTESQALLLAQDHVPDSDPDDDARCVALVSVDLFNASVPIGSEVIQILDDGSKVRRKTWSGAWMLRNETPVVLLEGVSGACALERLLIHPKPEPAT